MRAGKGSLWLILFPHLGSTIRSNVICPKCIGAHVPISYSSVAKSQESVVTCLVGYQLL